MHRSVVYHSRWRKASPREQDKDGMVEKQGKFALDYEQQPHS